MNQSKNSLLDGITVLDLSRLLPGPYCSQQLAQLGATVIKIEDPKGGDYARSLAPELFELINRGKESLCLDLRQAEDRKVFKRLVKDADVLIESFRPGVMQKLGCDYQALKAINPKLVYAAITGYGQNGPLSHLAGHDLNYLATAGVLDQIGAAGRAPALSNVQIADIAGGAMNAAIGILAAVIGAQKTGLGEFVDVSMTDGALAMNTVALAALNQQGTTPKRGADMLSGALPNYRVYQCRDGRYLAVGALEPQFFIRVIEGLWSFIPAPLKQTLASLAGSKKRAQKTNSSPPDHNANMEKISQLLRDPLKSKLILKPLHWALSAAFKTQTQAQWQAFFADKDACVSAVLTLEEAIQEPVFKARAMLGQADGKFYFNSPIKFQQDLKPLAASPKLGSNNCAN